MYFWTTLVLTLVIDRFTKYLVTTQMLLGQTIPLIPNFLHITYVKNPGAAFGILAEKTWFFIVITILILAALFYLAYTEGEKSLFLALTLGLVAGGAIGNLIDRMQTGLVIDYIDFRGIWPFVFNMADSAIVVGMILLAYHVLKSDKI
ncbi:MAG: lspA [Peptococcaceae bacterium]|nr:lspA [Peptococcaceae bacterium]